jgi:site-specific DNA-methyltransferase (adenine-specific)
MPDDSIDAIVTDPPYGLNFMGQKWDTDTPKVDVCKELLRVLKPGGHLIMFAGSRTYHRTATAVEDAGFEIRDQLLWLYGSGFPKSHNISKAIDKDAGANRDNSATAPTTPEAQQWEGWGTSLKPAHEPAVLARKPLDGRVIDNVLKHGTGGLNVDACRVEVSHDDPVNNAKYHAKPSVAYGKFASKENNEVRDMTPDGGRWPANLCHDGSDEVTHEFPNTKSGKMKAGHPYGRGDGQNVYSKLTGETKNDTHGDSGSAVRFFYCAKASRSERNAGLDGFVSKPHGTYAQDKWSRENMGNTPDANRKLVKNHHPTVKPIALMRWLCRLVTPLGGTILDPFMGSGSTGCAAVLEGFDFVGIDMEPEYVDIARARIEYHKGQAKASESKLNDQNSKKQLNMFDE